MAKKGKYISSPAELSKYKESDLIREGGKIYLKAGVNKKKKKKKTGKYISNPEELKKYKESDIMRVNGKIYLKPGVKKKKPNYKKKVNDLFKNIYGREANAEELKAYANANTNFGDLASKMKDSERAVNYQAETAAKKAKVTKDKREQSWEKDVEPWLEKEKQKQLDKYKTNKQRLDEQYQEAIKRGDRDKAIYIRDLNENYNEQIKSYTLNINKLKKDFNTALKYQNQDKLQNIARLTKDYSTAMGRLTEDRQVRFDDIERMTGKQLMANEVNYAERGLYRSGGKTGSEEYIGEEAEREKDRYQQAFERHQADLDQNKQRGTQDIRQAYRRNVAGLRGDYGYNKAQEEARKRGFETNKRRGLRDYNNKYNDWLKDTKTGYQQSKQDINTSWQDYLDDFRQNKQSTRASWMNTGNKEGWDSPEYQGYTYKPELYNYNNK